VSEPKKKIEVVAAVVFDKGNILCVQRPSNKKAYISEKWEFPGGKVEQGESLEEALIREIIEELSIRVDVEDLLIVVDHEYPDFVIKMHTFKCHQVDGVLTLNEHINHAWLSQDQLNSLDWAAADLPIVEMLTI